MQRHALVNAHAILTITSFLPTLLMHAPVTHGWGQRLRENVPRAEV